MIKRDFHKGVDNQEGMCEVVGDDCLCHEWMDWVNQKMWYQVVMGVTAPVGWDVAWKT